MSEQFGATQVTADAELWDHILMQLASGDDTTITLSDLPVDDQQMLLAQRVTRQMSRLGWLEDCGDGVYKAGQKLSQERAGKPISQPV